MPASAPIASPAASCTVLAAIAAPNPSNEGDAARKRTKVEGNATVRSDSRPAWSNTSHASKNDANPATPSVARLSTAI